MEIIKTDTDELNAVLTVKLSPEDYQKEYDATLKTYKKQINLPGFRPGKIPTGVIKKKYGKSILAEEINKILGKSLQNYIIENKLGKS